MVTLTFWLVLSITSLVSAQDSATCTDQSLSWLYNTQDQSPCYVAEQVSDVCGRGLTLPPLDPGDIYFGPLLNQTNYCECSSVFYSLVSACAACQDRSWFQWSRFSQNCSRTWVSTFLGPNPANVTIPLYAFINITDDDTFNLTAASHDAFKSGSTSTSHSSSKTGPIVGAVVACVAALVIAGALLFWFYRRRRRTMIDRLPKRRHYKSLSDPVTPAWTAYPQPVYQPEKRRDSLNSTYLQMQSPERQ